MQQVHNIINAFLNKLFSDTCAALYDVAETLSYTERTALPIPPHEIFRPFLQHMKFRAQN
jgi:hypothetical protein